MMKGCLSLLILVGLFIGLYSQTMGDTRMLVTGGAIALVGGSLLFAALRGDEARKRTGLRCPACLEDAAVIESSTPPVIAMYCPICGHRWQAEEPGTKEH